MPPKKEPPKKADKKNKSNGFQNYKIRDVDKQFFEIQFKAKEKIINRLFMNML